MVDHISLCECPCDTSSTFSAEKSSSVSDSKSLSSFVSDVFAQTSSVSAENSSSVHSSESLPLLASSSLIQDSSIPGQNSSMWYDSGSRTSSTSSVGLKIVSSTDTYRKPSSSASSVCYCPCNRPTVFSSPSSSRSISASKSKM